MKPPRAHVDEARDALTKARVKIENCLHELSERHYALNQEMEAIDAALKALDKKEPQ